MSLNETAPATRDVRQNINAAGNQVVDTVKDLIAKGNARSIKVKRDGRVLVELPLTVGVVGSLLAPQLTVAGTLAVLLTQCSIEVVRNDLPTISQP